ncbi:MAG: ribonuclease HI [Proteobacteria bacterium]|jgi:ribonuclease HI|nr:ribonuclease HI [Pseudomonadota bacterium]
MQEQKVIIHTDGACKGNPGLGSWAATLEYKGTQKEISGVVKDTTNNQMELKAVIEALKCLKKICDVVIYTDSQYVQKGITEWIQGWKQRGWKKVKNIELWIELDNLTIGHKIDWQWVRGHNGHAGNEYVDKLANLAIENYLVNK